LVGAFTGDSVAADVRRLSNNVQRGAAADLASLRGLTSAATWS
jgi:hypothetical protein